MYILEGGTLASSFSNLPVFFIQPFLFLVNLVVGTYFSPDPPLLFFLNVLIYYRVKCKKIIKLYSVRELNNRDKLLLSAVFVFYILITAQEMFLIHERVQNGHRPLIVYSILMKFFKRMDNHIMCRHTILLELTMTYLYICLSVIGSGEW